MATHRKGQGATVAPLIIILLIGAAIIFYVISIPPAEREMLIGPVAVPGVPGAYSRVVLDENPGFLNGATLKSKNFFHDLPSVIADNGPQPETRRLSTEFLIKRNIISDVFANFDFDIISKTDLANANLEMFVQERKEKGELIVTLNEIVVFTSLVEPGQRLVVALPVDLIAQGRNNVKIYAAGPGIRFWTTNSYSLSAIDLVLGVYSGAKATQSQAFALSATELADIRSVKYETFIRQTSEKSAELKLSVNGQQFYKAIPPATTAFSIDLPPEIFRGTNSLEWSAGRGGAYAISFGKLTVSTATTAGTVKTYSFTMASDEIANIALYNCELTLTTKTAGQPTQPITVVEGNITAVVVASAKSAFVNLNGNSLRYSLANGIATDDVCEHLRSGSNTLRLSAPDDITVDKLTLAIKGK